MVDTKAKELLNREIESQISNLGHMQPGSDEASKAVEDVSKLYKLKLEEERLKEESKSSWMKIVTDVGKFVGQSALVGAFWIMMFRYEETGSITGRASNAIVSHMKLPKF